VHLPLHRVSDLKAGGVASILREDAGNAGELLFSMIYNPWRAVIQLIGTLAILTWVDWRLLLGALVFIPIVWISHRTWIERIRPVHRDVRRTRQGIDAQATESFGGIRVVRGFHRTDAEAGRFTRDNHLMLRQELLAWWWSRLLEIAWQVLIPLASAGVLIYGGWRVLENDLTIGDLMAFTAYVLMLLGPLEALVATAAQIQSQLAGFDRTLDLFDEPREFEHGGPERAATLRERSSISPGTAPSRPRLVGASTGALHRGDVLGCITLDNVSFRYPRSHTVRPLGGGHHEPNPDVAPLPAVLEDISLEAAPGETIALVGPSGSGKTTLCNLIARFYDPTSGRVLLDGVDLRDLDVDSYRRLLGIVEQDVFLFDGTVAENIAYARRQATDDDIAAAAETANAHGFITELEEGYDTLIGERGVRLSGGQKQRLAIARAVLADPKILILDEATSNLDSESERLIQASLNGLMRDRTSFVIAHRLSTIRHADRIVVLERGRVVETGTHTELVEHSGRYADLLHLQIEGARL
ncbi:MAG: ABC transporter ATP-binding protein/permease, partial [Phycisphaerales bacterium]|nr:ABC transporter ATP-binding protein/permease [Phycisphaerales bacterium]